MSDHYKTKIAFSVALLAVGLASYPLIEKEFLRFLVFGVSINSRIALSIFLVFQFVSVYAFSVCLVRSRPFGMWQNIGDTFYLLSVLVIPAYTALYVASQFGQSIWHLILSEYREIALIALMFLLWFFGSRLIFHDDIILIYRLKYSWKLRDKFVERMKSDFAERRFHKMAESASDIAYLVLLEMTWSRLDRKSKRSANIVSMGYSELLTFSATVGVPSDIIESVRTIFEANTRPPESSFSEARARELMESALGLSSVIDTN